MHPQKSLYTALLPILVVAGAIIFILMVNKHPLPKKTKSFEIQGPTTPPPVLK